MKKAPLLFSLLFPAMTIVAQQGSITGLSVCFSSGINNHAYTRNYTGWYIKTGLDKKIKGGLSLGFFYTHTGYNNFPGGFHIYNFQPAGEQALLDRWKGISEQDWLSGNKGYYKTITGDILSLELSYLFRAGKRIRFIPHVGISRIFSANHTTGVFEAQFVNNVLTGGRIGYDFRNSRLMGWNAGVEIGFRLTARATINIHVEDNRDINGGGFNYYDAKQLGIGMQYRLSNR